MMSLVLAFASLLSVTPHDEAEAAIRTAEAAFVEGRYEAAAEAFSQAYALEQDRRYLYAWAQAERLSGDCASAVELYRRFLALQPPPPAAEAEVAQANLDRCAETLPASSPTTTNDVEPSASEPGSSPPVEAEPDAPSGPVRERDDAPQWYRDAWGGALTGLGIAGVGVGAGLLGFGVRVDRDADDATTEDEFLDRRARGRTLVIAGGVTLGVGAAVLIGGIVRYVVVERRAKQRRVQAGLGWNDGPSVSVRGRF